MNEKYTSTYFFVILCRMWYKIVDKGMKSYYYTESTISYLWRKK